MKPVLEQIHLRDRQSILAFRHRGKHFETPWHFHPQHELTYIEASTGTKFIGDYVGEYRVGEWVLLRSNLPHCWKNQVQQDSWSISTVVQWNRGIFAKIPELAPVFDMLRAASRGIIFSEGESAPFVPMMLELPSLDARLLYVRLLELLLRLSECSYRSLSAASFEDDLPDEYSSRMAIIHDFVEANFQRKIYLREVAKLVNMSEQSFSRFFSNIMGRPFFTFLNEYRINMASRMLIDTDWSVAPIGYACGYESLPFFHKQFNKFKGESPLQYRKRYAI